LINKNNKILIIGLGLIGGSYAEGLSKKGYKVYGLDINNESIEYAKNNNFIIDGCTLPTREFVNQFDLIIFSLYPKLIIEWLNNYQDFIKPNTIITDVTGIKGWLVKEIKQILRKDLEFIGAHPMAGREVSGVKNSDSNIFKGANYIITPENNSNKAIEIAKEIGKILEFKNISILSVEEHDEMIGFLSQLTHCIAISLMTCKESKHLVEYTGDSFRDLTRIAKINENLWSELFFLNKEELLKQINLYLENFNVLKQALETDNVEKVKEIMRDSTLKRSYFDRKC
jgi:prephenate dehydrogenase